MTPKERIYAILKGDSYDRPAVTPIFMAWSANFIGHSYRDYYLDGDVLVEAQLAVARAFNLDQVSAISDPWRIQSLAGFDEFAADPNYWSGFTRLETDVNLAGRTYSTAVIAPDVDNSNYYFNGTAFTGVFDGNDHKIINLTIDDGGAGNDFLGLFGYIVEDGEVKNLGLEGGSVSGDSYVGGLLGGNGGNISNCYSTGDVSGGYYVGGLVGFYGGSISNCYSTGNVSGYQGVGGLVGLNYGSVSNCYSTGNVSGYEGVGGLVGLNYGSISNCYSTGSVSSDYRVGGLVGLNNHEGYVSNCYSTGSVSGDDDVGGLAGYNHGSISNCHSTGDVSSDGYVGGLVGYSNGTITNCYSTGDVSGEDGVGGLLGDNYGYVSNCYSTGDVNGLGSVGGLVGWNSGSVANCYSTGDVNGVEYVGGLVGHNGLIEWNHEWGYLFHPGFIFNSYSNGSVQGTSLVGGLVGVHEFGDIDGSFWDVETSGEPNMCGIQSEYATGCDPNCGNTTAEMQTRSTFTDAGWDFVEIWGVGEGQTYPYLRFAPAGDLNYDKKVDLFDFAIFADHWLEGITP